MNFSRKTILVVGAAMLAACGDKVTVSEYTPPATVAKVNSVETAPASATMNVGQTITLTAAVNADAGVATTVTWSSSDATKASVSTAGVVTAVAATPGVAICATSTVDTGKKGCSSISVTAATAVIPASVSINSITASGNLNGTVNPAAVAGAIDVTLNVNPGNQVVSKVEVLFGGSVAYTQTFTAAQAAAMRYAADQAVAEQTTFPQVVASINTAAFNATTGVPTWANGATTLQAKVYTTASGSSTAASASVSQNLTLANVNAFAVTTVAGGTTGTANNAAGFKYTKGDLTVNVVPVSYNGVAAANIVVNFGTAACDGSATAQRQKATTATGNTFSATFANSGAAGATNLSNYSFNSGACAAANLTGEQFSIVAATDGSGNAFTTTALPINVGTGYRVDNWAPTAPTLNFTVAAVRNTLNWVNDALPFNNTLANGGAISVASTDNVGGIGLSTTPTSVYQVTVGGNVIANASTLAESANNTTYSATAKAVDLLGNTSAASAAATFGVDRTIPTFTTALAADASVIGAPGAAATGVFTYSDPATLPAGPSNPSATPVRITISKWTSATARAYYNSATPGWDAAGGSAKPYNIGLAGIAGIDPAAVNSQGYYVVSVFVEDGAANPSASITRTYLYDTTAPAGPFSIPVMTASAGQSNLFTSSLTDNIDIASSQWTMRYDVLEGAPGAVGAAILLPITTYGSFQSWTTTGTDAANYPLFRSMTTNAGAANVFPYVPVIGAQTASLQAVAHQTIDRAANSQAFAATAVAIPAVNLPTVAAADPYAAAQITGGFVVSNAAKTVDIDCATVAVGNVCSVDLTATVTGTLNTMPVPFTRVDFFIYHAASNTYRFLGTAGTTSVLDNATNRVYTYTLTGYNPDAIGQYNNPGAAGAQSIIAIGWNSTFDAVRTAANVNITTTP